MYSITQSHTFFIRLQNHHPTVIVNNTFNSSILARRGSFSWKNTLAEPMRSERYVWHLLQPT